MMISQKALYLFLVPLVFVSTASGTRVCSPAIGQAPSFAAKGTKYHKVSAAGTTAKEHVCSPGIGDAVPSFTARSTKGIVHFPRDYAGKWIVFFSHPADFTPVCTTEFKRLAGMADELEKKFTTVLVGLSVDSEFTHKLWLQGIEKEMRKEGKQKRKVNFPVVADTKRKIAKQYGMIHPNESETQTVRSVFIIGPDGKLRASFFYPIANGRSFNEIKRILIALQTTDEKDVATPADWQPGKPTISKETTKKDILPD